MVSYLRSSDCTIIYEFPHVVSHRFRQVADLLSILSKGVEGNLSGNVHRSRHALNADTIREMHAAFRQGGREAIDKVMRTQPAVFLKLLVLLVPRQMTLDHSGGIKAMTDEQIERSIEFTRSSSPAGKWELSQGD